MSDGSLVSFAHYSFLITHHSSLKPHYSSLIAQDSSHASCPMPLTPHASYNTPRMPHKDFIEIHDYTADEVREIFELARDIKAKPHRFDDALEGQTLAMIFEKSSTRTRVSFEAGMFQLGGHALFLSARDIQLGRGEPIPDTARVLSRYVDGIMARTFAHRTVTDLAEYASIPVINGLTDLSHPCQAMTDYFTAWEHLGDLKGKKIAYIGAGNNMAHSLMFGASKVGMNIAVATPGSYAPDPMVVAQAKADADHAGTKVIVTTSIDEAAADADVI